MKREDLIGKQFGRLTVLEQAQSRKGRRFWKCLCECGNMCEVSNAKLTGGYTTSCGCARKGVNAIDIAGQRFGRLIAIKPTDKRLGNSIVWEYQCDCGNVALEPAIHLRNGTVRSCGCLARETRTISAGKALDVRREYVLEGTDIFAIKSDKPRANNTSGYKGISYDKSVKLWKAVINFKGRRYYLGSAQKPEDLVDVYREAKDKLHGEFLDWYAEHYPERWERIKRTK